MTQEKQTDVEFILAVIQEEAKRLETYGADLLCTIQRKGVNNEDLLYRALRADWESRLLWNLRLKIATKLRQRKAIQPKKDDEKRDEDTDPILVDD